jgi:hypothetical protein
MFLTYFRNLQQTSPEINSFSMETCQTQLMNDEILPLQTNLCFFQQLINLSQLGETSADYPTDTQVSFRQIKDSAPPPVLEFSSNYNN